MNRRKFIEAAAVSASAFIIQYGNMKPVLPDTFLFKDDGLIPNSKYPLLLYRDAFTPRGEKAAEWLETTFASNNWSNSWRWGVYPFHHYHSNTHEVLGVFSGSALLHLGGEKGEKVKVQAGDIIVIPAGVGHKCINHTDDFTVVGAYPNGMNPDLKRGEKNERPSADQNISAVPVPGTDPLMGKNGELFKSWK